MGYRSFGRPTSSAELERNRIERESGCWALRVVSPPVAPEPVECIETRPEEALSLNAQIALMSIAYYDTTARSVYAKLKDQGGIPTPVKADYEQLAALGLAVLDPITRFHKILFNGTSAADHCAMTIAKRAGIHTFHLEGDARYYSVSRCCCGTAVTFPRSTSRMSMGRINAENRHLAHVKRTQQQISATLQALAHQRMLAIAEFIRDRINGKTGA